MSLSSIPRVVQAGVPDWRRHKDPLKEADAAAVAADHSAEAQSRWEAQLNETPGSAPLDR